MRSTRLAGNNRVAESATSRRCKCTTLDLFGKRSTEWAATLMASARARGLNNAARMINLRMSSFLAGCRN
ncbi:hypothetical protein D3C85_1703150 [compost metagenome]